jgi:hypothetical protein
MSDYFEKKVLDYVFRNASMGLDATNVWVALGTAGSDASFTELGATGSYARVAVVRTGAGWNAATGTTPAASVNTGTVTFPTATADWNSASNISYFAIYDAATAGNCLYWADLITPKPVKNGDTASFAAGILSVTQD